MFVNFKKFGVAVGVAGIVCAGFAAPVAADTSTCACQIKVSDAGLLGHVSKTDGRVLVSTPTGFEQVQNGVVLTQNSRLLAGPQSTATAKYGEACTVELASNSRLSVIEENGHFCVQSTQTIAASNTEIRVSSQSTTDSTEEGAGVENARPVVNAAPFIALGGIALAVAAGGSSSSP